MLKPVSPRAQELYDGEEMPFAGYALEGERRGPRIRVLTRYQVAQRAGHQHVVGPASALTRAPMCTPIPPMSSPRTSHSQVTQLDADGLLRRCKLSQTMSSSLCLKFVSFFRTRQKPPRRSGRKFWASVQVPSRNSVT